MSTFNRTLFASTLYLSILSCTALWAMDQNNLEEHRHAKILPINIEECEATADEIRKNDQLSDLEAERLNDLAHLQFQNLVFHPEEDAPEISQEEKERKLQEKIRKEELECIEMQKRFLDLEQKIFTKALRILSEEMKEHYKYLVRGKKFPPSHAILELTKDIDTQPRALELLALIKNYDEYVSMYCFNRDIGDEALLRIHFYYLEKYNERTALSDPHQMNGGAHELLQLCQEHTPTNPMTGIDDPECSLMHISHAVDRQLLNLKLWYLDNPTLVRKLPATDDFLRLFTLGIRLLECKTYGLHAQYTDLAYMLKLRGFKGVKAPLLHTKNKKDKQFQHIWVHPDLPLQVRITQNGKLTVGLVKKIPFREDGQIEKRLTNGEELNEFYKINNSSAGYVIPAGFENKIINALWSKEAKRNEKDKLMDEAHPILNQGYMNFDKATELLHPEEEGLPEYQSKKNKKTKKPTKLTKSKKK